MRPRRVHRKNCHLSARFTALTMLKPIQGEGYTSDLSVAGCRIESDIQTHVGMVMSLKIDLVAASGYRARILVEAARVRWVRPQDFGVEFLKVTRNNQLLLMEYVHETQPQWVTPKPVTVRSSPFDD